jgi:RNA polymerase sigma-70 factor (ECF subfamily)
MWMSDYSSLADQELLQLMKQDKQPAFDELYNRYWKKVLAVAIHKINDIAESESIVQDIFFSLWKRRLDIQISTSFNNYLMASVKYRVIKVLDKQRRQRLYEEQSPSSTDLIDDSTQQYIEYEELRRRLEELVGLLPHTCQLIYRMNKEEGKSYKEIANELGVSEKSVDAHLVRAKKTIRSGLDTYLSSFFL